MKYDFGSGDWLCSNYYSQYDFIYDKADNQLVTTIIRYENLEKELMFFMRSIGVTKNCSSIFKTKINATNQKLTDLNQYYTPSLLEYIHKSKLEFTRDLKVFKYKQLHL